MSDQYNMTMFETKGDNNNLVSESSSDIILSELANLVRIHHNERIKRVMSPVSDQFDLLGNNSSQSIESCPPFYTNGHDPSTKNFKVTVGSPTDLGQRNETSCIVHSGLPGLDSSLDTVSDISGTDSSTSTPKTSNLSTSSAAYTVNSTDDLIAAPSNKSSSSFASPPTLSSHLDSPTFTAPVLDYPQSIATIPGSKIGATDVDRMMLLVQARDNSRRKPPARVTKSEGLTYTCNVIGCGKSFRQLAHLRTHMRIHDGERPHICPFENCNKNFSQLCNLRTHIRSHTGERPYRCSVCGKSFSQQGNMRHHQLTHYNENPLVCKLENCCKTFNQLGNLKAHQNTSHKDLISEFTQRLIDGASLEDMDQKEREMFDYFCELYKNCNRGIKGRGKGTKTIVSRDNRTKIDKKQKLSSAASREIQMVKQEPRLYSPNSQSFEHISTSQSTEFSQPTSLETSTNETTQIPLNFEGQIKQMVLPARSQVQQYAPSASQPNGMLNDIYFTHQQKAPYRDIMQSQSHYMPVSVQYPYTSLPPSMPYYYVPH